MAGDSGGDPALRILPPQLKLVNRGLELVGSGARVVVPLFMLNRIPQAVLDRNQPDELAESLNENDSRAANFRQISSMLLAANSTELTPFAETAASQTRAAAWAKRRAVSRRGQAVNVCCWRLLKHGKGSPD